MRGFIPKPGKPAPWFEVRSAVNPRFHFDTVAGRIVVLSFFQSAAEVASWRVLDDVQQGRSVFDDAHACFFGVSTDPEDERLGRVCDDLPGIRFFWDFDRQVSGLYGAVAEPAVAKEAHEAGVPLEKVPEQTAPDETMPRHAEQPRRLSVVLDERLRVVEVIPFGDDPDQHVARILAANLPFLGEGPPPMPKARGCDARPGRERGDG
jgi:peroxiredoxin